ncbi:unnamed protein product [Periconia digitata]|uniref:Uncharacterized protein n=1 Tax=Periconia digitata TaxID=1303443 RepID=A0A9W4UID3_9PLEO|nr:unnamed protein product [Periconia digitata]
MIYAACLKKKNPPVQLPMHRAISCDSYDSWYTTFISRNLAAEQR